MSIEVEAPDGTIVEFPDGTSRETIKSVMAKRWPKGGKDRFSARASGTARAKQDRPTVRNAMKRSALGMIGNVGAGASFIPDVLARGGNLAERALGVGVAAVGEPIARAAGAEGAQQFFNAMGEDAASGTGRYRFNALADRFIQSFPDAQDSPTSFSQQFLGAAMVPLGPKLGPQSPPSGRFPQPKPSPKVGGSAAQKAARAKKFGIDLSIGDAGGRGAKVVERALDAMPGSAGVMQNARNALAEQTVKAVDDVAGTFGPATSFRGMGEAAQQGARGWITRFTGKGGVSEKAYGRIPISGAKYVGTGNTQRILGDLSNPTPSNELLSQTLANPKFSRYLTALRGKTETVATGLLDDAGRPITREVKTGGNLSWSDLKRFRTEVGEELGDAMIVRDTRTDQLRALYGALSKDMEAAAKASGPDAYRKFKFANDLFKRGMERIENGLVNFLGKADAAEPEKAARLIQTIATEGRSNSNFRLLSELRKSLKPDEWGEVSNGFVRLMGQPANSPGRAFDAGVFVRNYSDMAPEAKAMLFGNKALRANLDEFVQVMGDIAASGATRNTSNTGLVAGGIGTLTAPMSAAAAGNPLSAIMIMAAQLGGQYGLAKLWTNPTFIKAATGYGRAAKAGNAAAASAKLKALERVTMGIVGAANDNAAAAAVARSPATRVYAEEEDYSVRRIPPE